jgi:predicted trehalose synthase
MRISVQSNLEKKWKRNYRLECNRCKVSTGVFYTEAEALDRWNSRSNKDAEESIMGRHARVVKEYVCNYADDCCNFGNAAEEVYALLSDYEIDMWQSDEFQNFCVWEIRDKERLQEIIDELRTLPPNEVNEHFKDSDDSTNKNVADTLQAWLQYWNEEDGCIRVHWF